MMTQFTHATAYEGLVRPLMEAHRQTLENLMRPYLERKRVNAVEHGWTGEHADKLKLAYQEAFLTGAASCLACFTSVLMSKECVPTEKSIDQNFTQLLTLCIADEILKMTAELEKEREV